MSLKYIFRILLFSFGGGDLLLLVTASRSLGKPSALYYITYYISTIKRFNHNVSVVIISSIHIRHLRKI